MDELATVLALFGTQVRHDGSWVHSLVRSDDGFFNVRARMNPFAEVFVTPRALDGFQLTLRAERIKPASVFEDTMTISSNDHELARVWLDTVARTAVLDSAYELDATEFRFLQPGDPFYRPHVEVRRIWTYELAENELIVTKGTVENQADRMATVVRTACTVASRCRRWAAQYAAIAQRVDGKCGDEVALGGPPLITSNRAPVEVSLSLLRRLPGDRNGRLRTLITAKRVGLHDERTFSVVDETAARSIVPPLPKGSRRPFLEPYRLRSTEEGFELDEPTKKLIVAARPGAVVADLDSIDVWIDGAPLDPDQLDAAFALAAHLAIGNAAQAGPYR